MAKWASRRIARRRPPRSALVHWLFLRALGGIYLLAFTSLRAQVLGLYGKRGVRPVSELLAAARRGMGPERYRSLPTLFWLDDSDHALKAACTAGQTASVALLLGLAPRYSAAVLWALYESFVSVGREFLSFQWDVLLLEAGLLAALTAPGGLAPGRRAPPPSAMTVLLMRTLVFRLYLESGSAKLQSRDETWRKLTACCHYYETEPIPNRGGWYAHHLPVRAQHFATAAVLALECVTPFLVFGPRRARGVAFALFSGLQGAFALTGNYGFFNALSFVLGVWILDDDALPGVTSSRPRRPRRRSRGRSVFELLAGLPMLALSLSDLSRRFSVPRRLFAKLGPVADGVRKLERAARPFNVAGSYGLFAVMTTRRPEIVVEGSDDGVTWREYRFKYKAGDCTQPPRQVAPHQPRLDWQLWFAALGAPPGWFMAFLARLLEGSPEVLRLLEHNPFGDRPPLYIRALLYDYRMTSLEARRRTGAWWEREPLGLYLPSSRLTRPGSISPRSDLQSGPSEASDGAPRHT